MKNKVSQTELAEMTAAANALNEAISKLSTFKTGLVMAGVGTFGTAKEHGQVNNMIERLNKMSKTISKKIQNSKVWS